MIILWLLFVCETFALQRYYKKCTYARKASNYFENDRFIYQYKHFIPINYGFITGSYYRITM